MKRSLHRFLCKLAVVAGLIAPQCVSHLTFASVPDHSKYSPCPQSDPNWDFINFTQTIETSIDADDYQVEDTFNDSQDGEIGMVANAVAAAAGNASIMGRQATANVAIALETLGKWLPAPASEESAIQSNPSGSKLVSTIIADRSQPACQYDLDSPAALYEDTYRDCATETVAQSPADADASDIQYGCGGYPMTKSTIIHSPLFARVPVAGKPPAPPISQPKTSQKSHDNSPNHNRRGSQVNPNSASIDRTLPIITAQQPPAPSQITTKLAASSYDKSKQAMTAVRTYGPLREEYIPYDATPHDIWWLSSLNSRPQTFSDGQLVESQFGEPKPPVGPLRPAWDIADSNSKGMESSDDRSESRIEQTAERLLAKPDMAIVPLDCYFELLHTEARSFRKFGDTIAKLTRKSLSSEIAESFASATLTAPSQAGNWVGGSISDLDLAAPVAAAFPYLSIYANPEGGVLAVPSEFDWQSFSYSDLTQESPADFDELADFPLEPLTKPASSQSIAKLTTPNLDWQIDVIRSLIVKLDQYGLSFLQAADELESWATNRMASAARETQR